MSWHEGLEGDFQPEITRAGTKTEMPTSSCSAYGPCGLQPKGQDISHKPKIPYRK